MSIAYRLCATGLVCLSLAGCGDYSPSGPTNGPLSVTGITPTQGSVAGGTVVTLSGQNFTDSTTVVIGGTAATNVTRLNIYSLRATTAPHAAGVVDVQVGSVTLTGGYTYVTP